MQYRELGRSGMTVSAVCLGTMTFGTPVGEAEAIELTRWAIDQGITFIDTANIYEGYSRYLGSAGGAAEAILGKALEGRRDRVVLVTKVGNPVGPGPGDKGLSRAHVLRELDRSLARLRTDRVDVYYLHKPDPDTPIEETLAAFNEAIDAGKARAYGISNYDAAQIGLILKTCDERGLRRPLVCQPPYSLLRREIEQDLLPLCRREGLAVTPYQVLQSGLLTGKYRPGQPPPAGSRKAEKSDWMWEMNDDLFRRLAQFEADAKAAGMPPTQYAIAWALSQPGIASVVVGVKSKAQLAEAIRAGAGVAPL